MRNNIGFSQILVLIFLCILLFGDFSKLLSIFKKLVMTTTKSIKSFFAESNRRKGS